MSLRLCQGPAAFGSFLRLQALSQRWLLNTPSWWEMSDTKTNSSTHNAPTWIPLTLGVGSFLLASLASITVLCPASRLLETACVFYLSWDERRMSETNTRNTFTWTPLALGLGSVL